MNLTKGRVNTKIHREVKQEILEEDDDIDDFYVACPDCGNCSFCQACQKMLCSCTCFPEEEDTEWLPTQEEAADGIQGKSQTGND